MKKAIILFGLCLSLYAQAQTAGDVMRGQELLIGTKAPEIRFTDFLQNIPADTNFNGKFRVLEFWASWCGPCLAAVPHLNKLQEKFANENIIFLSVGYESPEKVAATLKKVEFKTIVVSDQTRSVHHALGIDYQGLMPIPRTVLIDDQNNIVWYGTPKKLTEKLLRRFLNGEKLL